MKLAKKIGKIDKKIKHILPKDAFALLTNRILFRLSFGLIGIFMPIFFYKLFDNSLYWTLLLYICLYSLGVILTPVGARLLNVAGMRNLMKIAVAPVVISIMALAYTNSYPLYAVLIYVFMMALYRMFYWVPYQTDLAKILGKGSVGIHMAVYKNILQLVNAGTPMVGGILIATFGFSNSFFYAGIVLLTTLLPIHFIRQVYERYSWGYFETYRHLLKQENRAMLYAYASDGAQSAVSAIVWPIFIFELLHGNYMSVGFVTSLTTIFILILNVAIGKFIDKFGKERILRYSTIFSATGWILKMFVDSAFQIFVSDSYHRLGRAVNRMGFDSATYEQAADNGHYIDEYTTLQDVAIDTGRVVMLILVMIMFYIFGNIRIIFILAALATLSMSFLNRQIRVK